jgi:hypothetical protein
MKVAFLRRTSLRSASILLFRSSSRQQLPPSLRHLPQLSPPPMYVALPLLQERQPHLGMTLFNRVHIKVMSQVPMAVSVELDAFIGYGFVFARKSSDLAEIGACFRLTFASVFCFSLVLMYTIFLIA